MAFSISSDFVFCVAPAVPKPHSGRPDLLILDTVSVTFSEVGSRPRFFVFLVTFGIPLGRRFGGLWMLFRHSFSVEFCVSFSDPSQAKGQF